MSTPVSHLPRRNCHLGVKVEERTFRAVEAFARREGYTLSSAVNRILMDWQAQQAKGPRKSARKAP